MDHPMGGLGTVLGNGGSGEVSHNTLWYNGASAGIRPDHYSKITYNRVVGQCSGLLMNDGSGIHLGTASQTEAQINHNWVHDSPKMGIRFDGGGHQLGTNGTVSFNTVWKCENPAIIIKGDNHTIESNLAILDTHGNKCTLCVTYRLRHDTVIENNNTITINNGATQADGGRNVIDGGNWPLHGLIVENNYSGGNVRENLYDSYNLDFRPLKNSNFTDGDLIGPYLPGYQSFYWIPGRKLYKTSTPIPPEGSSVGAGRDVLMFLGAYRADTYHWFLGTNEKDVENAEVGGDEYQGKIEEGSNVLELPKLKSATHYYWRVDAQWGGYSFKGDVWDFK